MSVDSAPVTPSRAILAGMLRAARMLGLCILGTAALLTFPNAIPWMIACWLLWHTGLVIRGRQGWVPLAVCTGVVLVKRVPWTPGLMLLGAVALAAVLTGLFVRRKAGIAWERRWAWIGVVGLWAAWGAAAIDWHRAARCNHPVALKPGQPVACLGDSMTSMGDGRAAYPERLAEMIAVPVVNLGQPGIDTQQAVASFPALVRARPQVVVVELGSHDFLKGRTRAETKAGLEKIVIACQEIGAEVVLMEMPRGYMIDPFAGLERELARQYDLELVPDTAIRRLLLASPTLPPGQWTGGPYLTEDAVHPNDLGNRLLARYVADALERMYGPAIRR
jgi:acyl-CoA thioesterase-1